MRGAATAALGCQPPGLPLPPPPVLMPKMPPKRSPVNNKKPPPRLSEHALHVVGRSVDLWGLLEYPSGHPDVSIDLIYNDDVAKYGKQGGSAPNHIG